MTDETVRAVLWDLDGTIVDSEMAHFTSWRDALAPEGVALTHERFLQFFGRRNEATLKGIFGDDISDAKIERIASAKENEYRASVRAGGARLLAGVAELLATLGRDGWRQAIVSSAPRKNVETVVEALGLGGIFGATVADEDVSVGKPEPEGMLLAASRLGAEPSRCVVVEDAPAGIEAGRRAGMATVGVLTTHDDLAADVVVRRLDELDAAAFDALLRRGE